MTLSTSWSRSGTLYQFSPDAAGHRVHAAGGEIAVGPVEEMPAKLRRAARRREREIGRGGLVLSPEIQAAFGASSLS